MKLKSRKLISALVAAFLVVVLAGSAFAFGTGNLVIDGRASVDAELSVEIRSGWLPGNSNYTISSCNTAVEVTIEPMIGNPFNWVVPHFNFDLVNVGSVDAIVTSRLVIIEYSDNWENFITINYEMDEQILTIGGRPGGEIGFYSFNVEFNFDDFGDFNEFHLNEYVTFRIYLDYNWYVPAP